MSSSDNYNATIILCGALFLITISLLCLVSHLMCGHSIYDDIKKYFKNQNKTIIQEL